MERSIKEVGNVTYCQVQCFMFLQKNNWDDFTRKLRIVNDFADFLMNINNLTFSLDCNMLSRKYFHRENSTFMSFSL